MTIFIGGFTCKVDVKGRVALPATFKKQMPEAAKDKFIIKKDIYEKCLVLYPMDEWQQQNEFIKANLNSYNEEHNRFLREFYKDTAEVEMDNNNRFVIPQRLLTLAEIDKENEVYMAGQLGKIELWSPALYNGTSEKISNFGELASKILGGNNNGQGK